MTKPTYPVLVRCDAMSQDDILKIIQTIPKKLTLSITDWARVYDPPLRPQSPPKSHKDTTRSR